MHKFNGNFKILFPNLKTCLRRNILLDGAFDPSVVLKFKFDLQIYKKHFVDVVEVSCCS